MIEGPLKRLGELSILRLAKSLPAVLLALAACTPGSVELDVSTSVLDVPTTSPGTTEQQAPATTSGPSTTAVSGLEPIVPAAPRVIQLRPILVADDAGRGRPEVSAEQIARLVLAANEVFEPAGFGLSFDPASELDELEDSSLREIGDGSGPQWPGRVVRGNEVAARYPGEVVVLIVDGATSDATSHHLDFLVLGADDMQICDEPSSTSLAHVVGLYLALPHTFATVYQTVSGAAEALGEAGDDPQVFDGDGFSDTAPDPGVYEAHRCDPDETVMIGDLAFDLPRGNLMSHYPERSSLSLQQMNRARWMLSLRISNGMAVPANTTSAVTVEAEDALVGTGSLCELPSLPEMRPWVGYQWVDSDQLLVAGSEGCTLEFDLPVPESGMYEVVALGTRSPDSGAVEFSVDGERFRFVDLYAPVVVATGPLALGETSLEPGLVRVTVDVVGSNTESSGASVGIDGFYLRRVGP